jgi:hypothetical protein
VANFCFRILRTISIPSDSDSHSASTVKGYRRTCASSTDIWFCRTTKDPADRLSSSTTKLPTGMRVAENVCLCVYQCNRMTPSMACNSAGLISFE